MGKYKITKMFDFCYGHRVHNQKLDSRFSIDNRLVCRHLHGHQGQVVVELSSDFIENDMVTDFKHLNFFKLLVDEYLDHKMILDIDDPALYDLFPLLKGNLVHEPITNEISVKILHPDKWNNLSEHQKEVYEGLVIVNFVPTSENLAKWLFSIVETSIKDLEGVYVTSVTFKETPKTSATYGL